MGLFDFFKRKKEIDDIYKALPAPSAEAPAPASKQINPTDISNSFMLDDLDSDGKSESTRGLDYDQLLAMSTVPLIASIIQTRVNQIAEFAVPSKDAQNLGFHIRLKDRSATPSDEDVKTMNQLYDFMVSCGDDRISFDTNFEAFLRMLVRDSLTYDQACFEVVRNRKGDVAGFINVDSSTIRKTKLTQAEKEAGKRDVNKPLYVQVMNNKTTAEFKANELCFGIRRPRSDVRFYGYGYPELQECVQLLTSLLNADIYNASNFTNGISVAGIIAVKSKMNPQLFRSFRREFYAMLSGSANAKKTPLLQLDPDNNEDLKAINLGASNKDMEFQQWQHYLIKSICSIYQIDPIELGFKFGNEGQSNSLSDGTGAERILLSREKGLRPLLRAIQYWLNKYIVNQLDDRFELVFTGLDATSPSEQLKMNIDKVKSFMTVNEIRALYDLEPLENGDIILNPIFTTQGSEV